MRLQFNLALVLLLLSSCVNSQEEKGESEEFITSNSGLKYRLVRNMGHEKANIGDILVMNMTYTADTLKLFDSYLSGAPMYLQVTNPAFKGSFEEGLRMIGKGDSAIFICSADSVYQKIFHNDLPGRLSEGSDMQFTISVEDVRNEERELQDYLRDMQIGSTPRPSGLYAVKLIEGDGPEAVVGKNVTVHYKTFSLDGREVRNSYETNRPLKFRLGSGSVVLAWEEILPEMRVGDKYRLISPSFLSYGARWFEDVPPYSPLVFDVELIKAE